MEQEKYLFFNKINQSHRYIKYKVPLMCKFDRNCNGSCNRRGMQVNHTNRNYCFVINCRNMNCTKNHLLYWGGISEKADISSFLSSEYAIQICKLYGNEIIRQIMVNNLDSISDGVELYTALERIIELNEKSSFENEDLRLHEIITNQMQEKKKMIEKIKIQKIAERIKLGNMMVKVYISAKYKQIIKQKFQDINKLNIFDIIDQFLGSDTDEKLYTPFLDL